MSILTFAGPSGAKLANAAKRLMMASLGVACVFSLDLTTQAKAQTVIQVGAPAPVAALWPFYVAEQQGLFRDAGLDVKFRYVGGGQGLQQLLSGDLNVFATNPDQPAIAIERGAKIRGFIGAVNAPFSLLVPPGIESFSELKGKKLGVGSIASSDTALIAAILSANGLARGDYEIVQTGSGANKLAALVSGNIQGVTLTQPQDIQYLKSQPNSKRLAFSSDVTPAQFIAAFYNVTWAGKNSEALKSFVNGLYAAKRWMSDPANRSQAVAALSKAANVSEEVASEAYDLLSKRNLFETALDINIDELNNYLRLAQEAGVGTFKDASNYFDQSWVNSAARK